MGRYTFGIYDVDPRHDGLARAIVPTCLSSLRLVPAGRGAQHDSELDPERLYDVLEQLRDDADLVIIDTPSGLRGAARIAAALSTHLIAVVQAEPLSARSFHLLPAMIRELAPNSPALLGVVVNMLDYRNPASVATLDGICKEAAPDWVFDVPLARTAAVLEASELGTPLQLGNRSSAPSAAWLFQGLAAAVLERLALLSPRVEAMRLV
jgi:cellulose biosynthesis protein BcsQ